MFSVGPKVKTTGEVWPVPGGIYVESPSNYAPNFSGEGAINENMVCRFNIGVAQMIIIWSSPSFLLEDVPSIQFVLSQKPGAEF
jgi:hypothetical protein